MSWKNLWFPVDFPLSQPIDMAMFNSYIKLQEGNLSQLVSTPKPPQSPHQPSHKVVVICRVATWLLISLPISGSDSSFHVLSHPI